MGLGINQSQLRFWGVNNGSRLNDDDMLVITFVRELSTDNDVSVMIDNTLNKDSTIDKVVVDGDVCEQVGIAIESETKVTIKRIVAIFFIKYSTLQLMSSKSNIYVMIT